MFVFFLFLFFIFLLCENKIKRLNTEFGYGQKS